MRHSPRSIMALLASISGLALSLPTVAQDCPARSLQPFRNSEPPGRDLFVPYARDPASSVTAELRNIEQLRALAEMNRLTVELVKRRSNPYITNSDTPQLVKRLKKLAKQLQELN